MIYDLTMSIEEAPIYPGDCETIITTTHTIKANHYNCSCISMSSHGGTHIDAPAHLLEGAPTLESIPVDNFVGQAGIFDCTTTPEIDLDETFDYNVEPNDIVIFYTGETEYHTGQAFHLTERMADFLIERGVKLVAIDANSVDLPNRIDVHKRLLGAGICIVENLVGLSRVCDTGPYEFICLPLKAATDGAPCRAILRALE